MAYVKMIMGGGGIKIDENKPVRCVKGKHVVVPCDTTAVVQPTIEAPTTHDQSLSSLKKSLYLCVGMLVFHVS